jgi:chromosome partitioning protein
LLRRATSIVIPVAPSAIDIHATANFIRDLLLVGRIRHRNIRLAVIANRVRAATTVYAPLERFVASLGMSFLTRIFDSEVYVEAAERGLGIFDMDVTESDAQRREFMPIIRWLQEKPAGEKTPRVSAGFRLSCRPFALLYVVSKSPIHRGGVWEEFM